MHRLGEPIEIAKAILFLASTTRRLCLVRKSPSTEARASRGVRDTAEPTTSVLAEW